MLSISSVQPINPCNVVFFRLLYVSFAVTLIFYKKKNTNIQNTKGLEWVYPYTMKMRINNDIFLENIWYAKITYKILSVKYIKYTII